MSISTKAGDNKATTTGSGKRVSKASRRVYLMGTADELCSLLGVAKSHVTDPLLRERIHRIQNMLFIFIAQLSDPLEIKIKRKIEQKDLDFLEQTGAKIESALPQIKNFIVYGETVVSAQLDLARAVARRLERDVVGAQDEVVVTPVVLQVLNRLSDTLYLFARSYEQKEGKPFVFVSYE